MKPTYEELERTLKQAKRSHGWMLESIKHGADETAGGNYSDELKHAILTQEAMDLLIPEKGKI